MTPARLFDASLETKYTTKGFEGLVCPISQNKISRLIEVNQQKNIPTVIGIIACTSVVDSTLLQRTIFFDGTHLFKYLKSGANVDPTTRAPISQIQYIWNRTIHDEFQPLDSPYLSEVIVACNSDSPIQRLESAIALGRDYPDEIRSWVFVIYSSIKALFDVNELEKLDSHIEKLIPLLRKNQHIPTALSLLNILLTSKSKVDEAPQCIDKLQQNKSCALSLYLSATIMCFLGYESRLALKQLHEAMAVDPDFAAPIILTYALLLQAGQLKAASDFLKPHVEAQKKIYETHGELPLPLLYSFYGELISEENPKEGCRYIITAKNALPDNLFIQLRYASHLVRFGSSGDIDPNTIFESIVRQHPRDPVFYYAYAMALRHGGYKTDVNVPKAINLLKHALALQGSYTPAIILLAASYMDLGTVHDFSNAHAYLQQAEVLAPTNAFFLIQKACYCIYHPTLSERNPREAARCLRSAYSHYSYHAYLDLYLANLLSYCPELADYLSPKCHTSSQSTTFDNEHAPSFPRPIQ